VVNFRLQPTAAVVVKTVLLMEAVGSSGVVRRLVLWLTWSAFGGLRYSAGEV